MEDCVNSAQHPGVVGDGRNSLECSFVRNKGDVVGGFVSSVSPRVFESKKERRRPRLIISDSESGEDQRLDRQERLPPGDADRTVRGDMDVGRRTLAERDKSTGGFRRNEAHENEIKRRKINGFVFDAADRNGASEKRRQSLDDNGVKAGGGGSLNSISSTRKKTDADLGWSQAFTEKKNSSKFGTSVKFLNGVSVCSNGVKLKKNMHLSSDFMVKERRGVGSDETVRLQGKNGVLKVILNKSIKNEQTDYCKIVSSDSARTSSSVWDPAEIRVVKKHSPPFVCEKRQKVHVKPLPDGNNITSDMNSEDSKLKCKHAVDGYLTQTISSRKQGITSTEKNIPKDCKQQKTKRGSSTEKQILRERIQKMLLNGGWKIDYRPRRNRDYLDSVYVSPTGTTYWSIIKAYDAFQKLSESELSTSMPNGDCIVFAPISKEVLSKLTRKTRKKMEKEMKFTGICRKKGKAKQTSPASPESKKSDDDAKKASSFKLKCGEKSKENSNTEEKYMIEKLLFEPNYDHNIKNKRCTLLVRKSTEDPISGTERDHFIPYKGKRTIISWLVDSGTVKLCEKVQYMNRKHSRVMLEGWITKDGIHCGCCSKILTVLKFEIHAGSKLRQPFQNIFLRSGASLMKCQLEAWNRQDESKLSSFRFLDKDGDDPNDDTCGLCGDGGDLICCDGCPSTFHQSCLHMQVLPPGEWNCSNCSCKFCGTPHGESTKGDGQTRGKIQKCIFCSKNYHESCTPNSERATTDIDASTFCGHNCQLLHESIHKALGVKQELDGGFSWSIIHRSDLNLDCSSRGFPLRVECNSKLAVALTIMDECFLPIVDRRSGVNLIQHVVYNCGTNFSRLDCCGFYTFILERGDEIMSAASVRIHGRELAEMPFIGTRHVYRRQGMCRLLLRTIEMALASFNVKRLIIPAIPDLTHTWTAVFGFRPLEDEHRNIIRSLNVIVFPDVDMLQKPLLLKDERPPVRPARPDEPRPPAHELDGPDRHLITAGGSEKNIPEEGGVPAGM